MVAEADFIADAAARLALQLFGNTIGDGPRRRRRGWVWPMSPFSPRPSSMQILGNWVVLPEPVSPATITTGGRAPPRESLVFLANRQVFRIGDGRTRRFAQQDFTGCSAYLQRHLLQNGLLRFRIFNLLHAVQTAGKARFVAQHQAVELLIKLGKVIFVVLS